MIVANSTSCGLMLKREAREILGIDDDDLALVGSRTFDICELLRDLLDAGELRTDMRAAADARPLPPALPGPRPRLRQAGARPARADPRARGDRDRPRVLRRGRDVRPEGREVPRSRCRSARRSSPTSPRPGPTARRATPRPAAGTSPRPPGSRAVHPLELLHRAYGLLARPLRCELSAPAIRRDCTAAARTSTCPTASGSKPGTGAPAGICTIEQADHGALAPAELVLGAAALAQADVGRAGAALPAAASAGASRSRARARARASRCAAPRAGRANRFASLKIGGPAPPLATSVEFALAIQFARTSRVIEPARRACPAAAAGRRAARRPCAPTKYPGRSPSASTIWATRRSWAGDAGGCPLPPCPEVPQAPASSTSAQMSAGRRILGLPRRRRLRRPRPPPVPRPAREAEPVLGAVQQPADVLAVEDDHCARRPR